MAAPFWVFAMIAAAVPAAQLFNTIKARGRQYRVQCIRCGYEFRATPARCLECGAIRVPLMR